MEDPIDLLMHEHRVIEKMIDVITSVSQHLDAGDKVPTKDLEAIIEFITIFADKCHHGKEEGILFPMLENKGIPREGGPIGVMLIEHEEGREAVHGMREALKLLSEGDNRGQKLFAKYALKYVNLLTKHIQKEDNILYVMARNVLSDGELSKMSEDFEHVEEEDIGRGVHEKYLKLVDELWNKYVK